MSSFDEQAQDLKTRLSEFLCLFGADAYEKTLFGCIANDLGKERLRQACAGRLGRKQIDIEPELFIMGVLLTDGKTKRFTAARTVAEWLVSPCYVLSIAKRLDKYFKNEEPMYRAGGKVVKQLTQLDKIVHPYQYQQFLFLPDDDSITRQGKVDLLRSLFLEQFNTRGRQAVRAALAAMMDFLKTLNEFRVGDDRPISPAKSRHRDKLDAA